MKVWTCGFQLRITSMNECSRSERKAILKALIEFIDRYAIDPHVYMVAPRVGHSGRYEIFWDREGAPTRWRLRLIGASSWERASSDAIIGVMQACGIDLERVEYQLRSVAMAQVVFAEALSHEARSLFGADTVERAVEDHQVFLNELKQLVTKYARGGLEPLTGGGQRSSVRRGHLSVVASG